MEKEIKLKWLRKDNSKVPGVTWGVPWEESVLKQNQYLSLMDSSDNAIPVQTSNRAYWPDGSVKWTLHSAVFTGDISESYYITKVDKGSIKSNLKVKIRETANQIEVDNGKLVCHINKQGSSIIDSVHNNKQVYCSNGKLTCIKEEKYGSEGSAIYREECFESSIKKVIVEEKGPIRGIVKIEGKHKNFKGGREWLPFIIRLYFYAGQTSFRIVHSFIYDGDKHLDYIKGLGIEFSLPLSGIPGNRYVRFVGDTGVLSEAVQLLSTWHPRTSINLYKKQIEGIPLDLDPKFNEEIFETFGAIPAWDMFKMVQDSSEHYSIRKRTQRACRWITAGQGNRSKGLIYAGSKKGGIAAALKDFWQKNPSSLEVLNMTHEEGKIKLWFWSPDGEAMDLRHYDTDTYPQTYYEGSNELRSTPVGIANTNELTVWCFDSTPTRKKLIDCAQDKQNPGLLICEAEYYHKVRAFGRWSLINRSSEAKNWLEDQLNKAIKFYQEEIEQRKWYGFWNYGDVMHSYDPLRHSWKYDIGGYAWQNTELVPTYWLWYSFLRSGRADIFQMAEAMSRHTSEVDIYHLGEYAGLGSRHNVLHWGCGCKEARISMAGHHRFYYYLTGDERIGDILEEVKDADFTTEKLDPMRAYYPKDQYPTHTRIGPDWSAFCSNWMTMWERYGNTYYRDKILKGIESLKNMPFNLYGASTFGYDPKSGEMFHMGKEYGSGSHLVICMGAPQIWMEMSEMIKDPLWNEMMAEYGRFYDQPAEEKQKKTAGAVDGSGFGLKTAATAMMSYAADYYNDNDLAKRVWEILLEIGDIEASTINKEEYITLIKEIPWVSTNMISQWALNVIVSLDFISNFLP